VNTLKKFRWGNALAVLFYALLGAASALADDPPPVLDAPPSAAPLAAPVLPPAVESPGMAAVSLAPASPAEPLYALVSAAPVADMPPDVDAANTLPVAALAMDFSGADAADVLAVEADVSEPVAVFGVGIRKPVAAFVLRDQFAGADIGAWAPILARIAALPRKSPTGRALTREEENLFQLRGYLRAAANTPEALEVARRVLPAAAK
jgi:hypothetical protein